MKCLRCDEEIREEALKITKGIRPEIEFTRREKMTGRNRQVYHRKCGKKKLIEEYNGSS